MTLYQEPSQAVPCLPAYEVVVGGGMAGIAAAAAAARRGAKTLLLEKSFSLGGLATRGLINWLEPYCDGGGRRVLGGIAWEVFQLALQGGYDSLSPDWKAGAPQAGRARLASWFSPEQFVLAAEDWLVEAGVELLYDTWAVKPVMAGKRCQGLLLEGKEGRRFLSARAVVDATGDAEICFKAGIPCQNGKNSLTLTAYLADEVAAQAALASNEPYLVRSRGRFGANMYGKGHPQGEPLTTGVTAEELTQYTLRTRRLMREKLKERPPRSAEVLALPQMPQLRTIRHMVGEAVFTGEADHAYQKDSVGVIPDYMRPGSLYEIPYGCLYHSGIDNLWAAGRIISCQGRGWHVSRVIGPALLTGQAAGEAAAWAAAHDTPAGELPVAQLQKRLAETGVAIHWGDIR